MGKNILKSGLFWTIVFGVLSIGLAILLYLKSNKYMEPVYTITKEPSIIFDKNNSTPKIMLLSIDSIVIDKNVYVSSIMIWNNGELEIKKSDVRKDFIISVTGEQSKILDYRIVQETRPDISKFSIDTINGNLKLNWSYFDPGFGLELQIIYMGTEKSEIVVEAYIIGQEIIKVTTHKKNTNFILVYLVGFILAIFTNKDFRSFTRKERIVYAVIILGVITVSILLWWFYEDIFAIYVLPL